MSGGQRQRVGFGPGARAPAATDPRRRARLDARRVRSRGHPQPDGGAPEREGVSILYITHDIASARYVADRILVMYGGHVVETGSARRRARRPEASVHPAAPGGGTDPARRPPSTRPPSPASHRRLSTSRRAAVSGALSDCRRRVRPGDPAPACRRRRARRGVPPGPRRPRVAGRLPRRR